MSCIVTTTYPSPVGLSAATYACQLAAPMRLPLHLLHAYTVPVTFGDIPLPVVPIDDVLNITTERVDAALSQFRSNYPGLEITNEISYGDFGDLLDDTILARQPVLTIIGNDEELDNDVWIGSNAASLLREAPIPVLAVPLAATYKPPSLICLACDTKSINEGHPVTILHRLQAAFNIQVTVLHLLANEELPIDFQDSALYRQLDGIDATYVEMSTTAGIDDAIANYAANHSMDWLAIIPHHYGFWEGLFHKSHTERMLQIAHIPVLALH